MLGSMLLFAVLILMVLNVLLQRRLSRRDARVRSGARARGGPRGLSIHLTYRRVCD